MAISRLTVPSYLSALACSRWRAPSARASRSSSRASAVPSRSSASPSRRSATSSRSLATRSRSSAFRRTPPRKPRNDKLSDTTSPVVVVPQPLCQQSRPRTYPGPARWTTRCRGLVDRIPLRRRIGHIERPEGASTIVAEHRRARALVRPALQPRRASPVIAREPSLARIAGSHRRRPSLNERLLRGCQALSAAPTSGAMRGSARSRPAISCSFSHARASCSPGSRLHGSPCQRSINQISARKSSPWR